MAQTPARRTPASTKKAATPKKVAPFEAVTDIDDDGNFTAKIFGEEFSMNADVNGWLKMLASSGSPKHLVALVESMINVEVPEGTSALLAREREKARFHDLMSSQEHFGLEDAIEFIGELMEASAGNDLGE
jgi:hypothetical protein